MDLNELFSRHQQALIAMVHNTTPKCRDLAEQCANYYADQIESMHRRLSVGHPAGDHQTLKRIIRG